VNTNKKFIEGEIMSNRCCTICMNTFPIGEYISNGKNKKPRSICSGCSTVVAFINTKRKLGDNGMKDLISKHTENIIKMEIIMENPSESSFEVARKIIGTDNIPDI
jgi:hypothetical protein